MKELIERLRDVLSKTPISDRNEAADAIERLSAELNKAAERNLELAMKYSDATEARVALKGENAALKAELVEAKTECEKWKGLADANANLVEVAKRTVAREERLKQPASESEPVAWMKIDWKREFRLTEERLFKVIEQRDELIEAAELLLGRKRPDDTRLILEVDCLNLEELIASIKPTDE